MTDKEIKETLKNFLVDELGVDGNELDDDTPLGVDIKTIIPVIHSNKSYNQKYYKYNCKCKWYYYCKSSC